MTCQIIYATTGGNTEYFVDNFAIGIRSAGLTCKCVRVEKATLESISNFDITIFATPTYNVGKLPSTFQKFYDNAMSGGLTFPGKSVTCISLGNSEYYDVFCGSKTFLDGIVEKLNLNRVNETILIDGETFGRSTEFIQLGKQVGEKLISTFSDFEPKFKDLNLFISPKSIAVVGASADESKIGNQIFRNIVNSDYKGEVIAVNKNAQTEILYEKKLVNNIKELPENIELVVLVVPNIAVIECIKDCIEMEFRNIVIIASGFQEIHTELGDKLEKELEDLIANNNLNILGPNCLGFINSEIGLNASFASAKLELTANSNLGIISQSGAIITELLDKAKLNNLKFSKLISLGNKNSIDECDAYKYLLEDEYVSTIFMYLEDIKNPQKFMHLLETSKIRKNTIILYPGESKAAQTAVLSHTGAIASSHDFANLQFQKYGIISAHSLQEVDIYLTFFSHSGEYQNDNFTILTNAGGPAVVLTDLMSENGLSLGKLSEATLANLKVQIPMLSGSNPLDIVGDADLARFTIALELLTQAEEIETIIVCVTPQTSTPLETLGKLIIETHKKTNKVIFPILYGDEHFDGIKKLLQDAGIPYFTTDLDLVRILKVLPKKTDNVYEKSIETEVATTKPNIYNTDKTFELLTRYKVTFPNFLKISSITDISKFQDFKRINKKYVFKIDNSLSAHKSDQKGVFVNISDIEKFTEIYKIWQKNFELESVPAVIQEQFEYDLEVFCGVKKDPHQSGFGYMMIIGFGGIYTNIFNDFVKLAMPFSDEELESMIDKLMVKSILDGARGKDPLDTSALIQEIMKIQNMVLENDFIMEADINPILVAKNGVCVPDVKVYL